SRANTAIAHTGFDAPPGSLEARLIARAHRRFRALCADLGVDLRLCGALMVALDGDEMRSLESYEQQAATNSIPVERASAEAVRARRPYVNPAVRGGLRIPDESSVDSFALTLAYAEVAVLAGAQLLLDERVAAIEGHAAGLLVTTTRHQIAARDVVNAPGRQAETIAPPAADHSLSIPPR